MGNNIEELQKSDRKPTKREEKILKELMSNNTTIKTILLMSIFSSILHFPILKNNIKKIFPFISNDYYYVFLTLPFVFLVYYLLLKIDF